MIFLHLLGASLLVSAAFSASSSVSLQDSKSAIRFNPRIEKGHVMPRTRPAIPQTLSNGERLAKGIPPKTPSRRPSTPLKSAPSGTPSKPKRGYLQVVDASNGTSLGFVNNAFNSFGEYGITTSANDRLQVRLDSSGIGPVNIATTNGPDADLPFLVFIAGFANTSPDLGPGKFNYVYFGAGGQTAVNAPPRYVDNSFSRVAHIPEGVESDIFQYTGAGIKMTWVNSDGSKPASYVGLYNAENVLFSTGDKNAFESTFGFATWVKIMFEVDWAQ